MNPSPALERYMELRKKLYALSAVHAPDWEIDAVLDEMDAAWLELTPEDMQAMNGALP